MGVTTIEWAHYTHNPWIGCEKISQGCRNCYASVDTYARVSASRGLPLWGPGSTRHRTSEANWRKPLSWNRKAALKRIEADVLGRQHERPRVFCASLCDVFEGREDLDAYRADLWPLIELCTELDWMLLTKRPENVKRMVPKAWLDAWPAHAWAGTSVENQAAADERIPRLLGVPARVRFLSMEPLLEAVDLTRVRYGNIVAIDCLRGTAGVPEPHATGFPRVHLVIVGGESGPGARPFDIAWLRSILRQCRAAGTKCFVKQFGSAPVWDSDGPGGTHAIDLLDRKGGNPEEWPKDVRVREMPEARR